MDRDRRVLRFYSDISLIDESVGLRRAFLPLLGELWPGWQVGYARRGLADLLEGTPVDGRDLLIAYPVPAALTADELRASLGTVTEVMRNPVDLAHYLELVSPLVQQLLAAGLVDELRLLVHPVAARKGRRLFDDGDAPYHLAVTATEAFPTGVIRVIYSPTAAPVKVG